MEKDAKETGNMEQRQQISIKYSSLMLSNVCVFAETSYCALLAADLLECSLESAHNRHSLKEAKNDHTGT